ncbi:MAG: hypothetical protein Q8M00_02380 [bacterium]|nr:hypothetical protein [bacterium]
MRKINTLLIGVGHHAKRIYLPYIFFHRLDTYFSILIRPLEREKAEKVAKKIFPDTIACHDGLEIEI